MKKHIWLAAGITGMLFGIPHTEAKAAVNINISTGSRPSFIINSPPSFIYLRTQGFSVSVGSPYDIVYYGNRYYIYHNGHWYRSYYYRGPWVLIIDSRLPYQIRRHRWEDIRRYRDIEYRRPDSRTNQYQRNDDNKRRIIDQRSNANNRKVQTQHENRVIQGQQNRAPEQRQIQRHQNNAPQQQQNLGQPSRAPEQRQIQRQQNNAPQQRQNQGQQNRAPEQRQIQRQQNNAPQQRQNQGQQNRAPEQRQMQRQQNNAPQQRQNQGQQNKGAENRKGPDQSNKDDRGKKN